MSGRALVANLGEPHDEAHAHQGATAASGPSAVDEAELRRLRARVIQLALLLGVVTLVLHVSAYVVGFAEVESAMWEVHQKAPASLQRHLGDSVHPWAVFASSSPHVLLFIAASMAVPLAGYLGAKRGDPRVMLFFFCCNGLAAVLSVAMVVLLVWALCALQLRGPELEQHLVRCDPARCLQLSGSMETIDCLAGLGRTLKFEGIEHLDADCPQAFLRCPGVQGDACEYPVPHGEACADRARVSYCSAQEDPTACGFYGRCYFNFGSCRPVGLPLDPTGGCTVNHEAIDIMRGIVRLAPVLLPRLEQMMWIKLLVTIPSIVVSCLSFFSGWSLYNKLSDGYVKVLGPMCVNTQDIQRQPARVMALGWQEAEPSSV